MRYTALLRAGAAAMAAFLAAGANAATLTFNSPDFSLNGGSTSYTNTFTRTLSGVTLTVSGFSVLGGNGVTTAPTNANVARFDGGFGVRNQNEGTGVSAPNHAVDNGGSTDMLLLRFTDAVTNAPVQALLTNFGIGWSQTDSDVSVLRWRGASAPDLLSGVLTFGATAWQLVNHYADVGASRATGAAPSQSSAWWIVSAYDSDWGASANSSLSDGNDYFKLKTLTAEVPDPPREVPEPGTWALLALGLAGLAMVRRRIS